MKIHGEQVDDEGKLSKGDYMRALEDAAQDEGEGDDESPVPLSEAERLAALGRTPKNESRWKARRNRESQTADRQAVPIRKRTHRGENTRASIQGCIPRCQSKANGDQVQRMVIGTGQPHSSDAQ